MISKFFDIENDGIEVHKERIEKWSYTKYPPKSKFVLWKNIKFILLLLIIIIICNGAVAFIDKDISAAFIGCDFIFVLMIGGVIWDTVKDWKYGKYWND